MITYEEMRSNYEIIKEMCKKYRKEMTVFGGTLLEQNEISTCSEYVKFMNELTFDEFVGNFFVTLLDESGTDIYKSILDGETMFDDFVEDMFGEDVKDMYLEEMKKL